MSVSFKSQTRDTYDQAHASKTQPPDALIYNPGYSQIVPKVKTTKMVKQPEQIAKQRIQMIEAQRAHVCLKSIKGLNYHPSDDDYKRKALKVAKRNKRQLEISEKEA